MVHRIVVEDQSLRWYGRPPKIADDSIEFVRLQFHLPEDWDPLVLVAQFTQADTYNMLLDGDTCFLPKELTHGLCKLSLFGYTEGKPMRATSIPLVFQIEESGFVSSAETPIPPTPDLYAQLIKYFSSIAGPGGGNVDLTGYATEQWVQDQNYLTKVPEGYAKTKDIPTKPEDIGAQPSGDYALKSEIPAVPVRSVNGKTGAVQLSADDVGARPDNWMPTASDVGADYMGAASSAVSVHNVSKNSHPDIRLELQAINARLTAFFNSDNQTLDELSEIVAYITNNKTLIQNITISKVSVSDIINNLVTNVTNKPLSAAQGVALKLMIDTVSNKLSNYAMKSEIPTRVSQLQNDSGYLKEHQDISGLLPRTELPAAIDTALAKAKASGEFDGKDGQDGDDGVSPTVTVSAIGGGHRITITDKSSTKTVDVMDGSPGKNGNGIKSAILNADYTLTLTFDDGTSYTTPSIRGATGQTGQPGGKGDPGTSVTVKSVTESTADGGSNVVEFSDGKTVTIKNGKKGADGKNPVKGVDYWTDADQEAMVQQVITALGTPVFGRVDADNNIILTGELADGTYTVKYEDAEGNKTDVGSIVIGGAPVVTLVWFDNIKLDKSTGAESADNNYFASDYVTILGGYKYTVGKRAGENPVGVNIMYYTADKQVIESAYQIGIPNANTDTGDLSVVLVIPSNAAYFRLRCYDSSYVEDTLTQSAPLIYIDVEEVE